ncbi:Flavodoxin reductase family protein [Mycetohabitans rhizoxinica HKI 454]|uniref:Flavodoxin reductase family protein n=1 Tax=Mycetohabitans rhizoxinica (strain DSM 19002 / CIP 109453 / HKI 454) TaxID=882378 RepID=E5AN16_MYCRK|nr:MULTISPECIES: CDP-6-deoxy-delta-3,4-glucoseen reductase [Mycetohabitans]MCF7694983.1 CDP-6-deoxy-delta-3,4-glucoseen reductase [Mycetohabitans sp. B2]MCG1046361.1 CDP-6-deoxy-delta-3,4-glucoseen reductase [Mycetohabitans sp. B6]CBW74097.1 Flavodoxin reductase family protein [Mycetohabitans rhizoxinica HKI 454]
MAFNVTIRQSGKQFQVEADEPVLSAALRQGIGLPYGCKNGACGSCKGQLVSGSIEQRSHSSSALSNDERTRGMALFCCTTAQSDLEIDIREIAGVGDMQVKKLPCRVNALERVAHDVIVLKLQLPANERLQYLAGQYIEFILKDGTRRSYSMASAPHHEGPLELHIRHMPGGVFTDHVFGAMKERDILRFEGPLGTFFLREDADKPIVLLASGTGFAPIKAIIEHAIFKGMTRPMTLYWGGRRRGDLYLASLAEQWARDVPNFKFVPVLSEPDPADGWQGRTGFVHRAVVEDLPDLSGYQVYACGAPVMVEAAQRDFTAHHGLPADEFYADSFTSAADLANAV